MDSLVVLGTGNAMALRCYNTCFVLRGDEGCFLVDGGGGNGILSRMEEAGLAFTDVREAFLSHSHTDHIFGMVWMVRHIGFLMRQGLYGGVFTVYCHEELAAKFRAILDMTLVPGAKKLLGKEIVIYPVADGETRRILGREMTFFDIHSDKEKQFGFTVRLGARLGDGQKLSFLGDEPFNERCEPHVRGSDWLLSEAFCLYSQRDRFKPYEKHHSTVKEACELAERLGAGNLVLWHTEDENIAARKELYTAEGREYFRGNLFVPDDLEVIPLRGCFP